MGPTEALSWEEQPPYLGTGGPLKTRRVYSASTGLHAAEGLETPRGRGRGDLRAASGPVSRRDLTIQDSKLPIRDNQAEDATWQADGAGRASLPPPCSLLLAYCGYPSARICTQQVRRYEGRVR